MGCGANQWWPSAALWTLSGSLQGKHDASLYTLYNNASVSDLTACH